MNTDTLCNGIYITKKNLKFMYVLACNGMQWYGSTYILSKKLEFMNVSVVSNFKVEFNCFNWFNWTLPVSSFNSSILSVQVFQSSTFNFQFYQLKFSSLQLSNFNSSTILWHRHSAQCPVITISWHPHSEAALGS
jgi:hypothetical protein